MSSQKRTPDSLTHYGIALYIYRLATSTKFVHIDDRLEQNGTNWIFEPLRIFEIFFGFFGFVEFLRFFGFF